MVEHIHISYSILYVNSYILLLRNLNNEQAFQS